MDHRIEVARACRILAHQGLVSDVLGHVSLRISPTQYLVRCRGPQERGLLFTETRDIHAIDLSATDPSTAQLPGGYSAPNELPIHAELLRVRPEVNAVVHAHPPAVVTASLAGLALLPIVGAYNIPAARLAAEGIPTYLRAVLIRRDKLAHDMMATMGSHPTCVLRGHGLVTTGATLAQAVLRALDVNELARLSLAVVAAGARPVAIPDDDLAELPDLGVGFNDAARWRYLGAKLQHDGLDVTA